MAPDPIDIRVGHLIRVRRRELGFSQAALALGAGVKFQQIQKYENGKNRVAAARLRQIADFLKVPPGYFFETTATMKDESLRGIDAFVASKEGMELIRAMTKVKEKELRHQIVLMIEEIANTYYAAD